jgi:hypothetical protein
VAFRYINQAPAELNRAADTVPLSPLMLCIPGGNAIDASPSGRLTACHPLGAPLAAGSWIDGTEPCGLCLASEGDDWQPAADMAAAITRAMVATSVLTEDRLDVAVTITGTAVVVPVVVTLVALRDPAATCRP